MVTKPARLLFLYAFVDLTVYNVEWRSYHYDLTDQQKRRINLFRHNLPEENKGLCSFRELPT